MRYPTSVLPAILRSTLFSAILTLLFLGGAMISAAVDPGDFQLAPTPVASVALNADPSNVLLVGNPLTFIATPTGITTPEYAFSVTLKDVQPDGSVVNAPIIPMVPTYGAGNSVTFTPTEPGRYVIAVWCREQGFLLRHINTYTCVVGTNTLTGVTSFTANRPSGMLLGDVPTIGIRLRSTVSGTRAGVQYFYSAYIRDRQLDGSYVKVPVTLSTSWGTDPNYWWHPTEAGYYVLTFTARDASCNVSYSQNLSFIIKPGTLNSIVAITASPIQSVVLNAVPVGGVVFKAHPSGTLAGTIEYFYRAKLRDFAADGSVSYTPVTLSTAWSTSPTFAWTPTVPGLYTIIVEGRDASGDFPVIQSLNYMVYSDTVLGVTSFQPQPEFPSGTSISYLTSGGVTFTATIAGTGIDVRYFYKIGVKQLDGTFAYSPLSAETYNNFITGTPPAPGVYRLYVYARDNSYNTVFAKSTTYTVGAPVPD